LLTILIATSIASLILVAIASPAPTRDVDVYAAAFTVLALVITPTLTRLNHLYTRCSSTTLLVFYPLYFVAQLISLRTFSALLRKDDRRIAVAKIALEIARTSILFIVWMLECIGPEMDEMVDGFVNVDEKVKESPYVTANFYDRYVPWLSLHMNDSKSNSKVQISPPVSRSIG
jgi:ATP-binding cassette subfamily C (CFTR/MRP) protein 1